jgi:uncharacterized protein (TIGR02597 family)
MRRLFISSLATAVALFTALVVDGQTSATTEPVGFTTTSCLANSDTFVAIPFTRSWAFAGAIQSVAGSTITVSNNPGWTTNQFVYVAGTQPNHYYALIGAGGMSNPKEGHTYAVTGNTANTLAVDVSADDLTGITANTQVLIIPFWTPGTIFPPSDANVSFTPTTSSASYQTQLRVPNNSASGINLPVTSYFFSNNVDGTSNNVGWRIVGDNTTDHGDDPLGRASYFIVRNANGAPTLPLKPIGAVLTKKLTIPLRTSTTGSQDNAVSMIRPIDLMISQTGLNPADGSFIGTPQLRRFRNLFFIAWDQLLLFDNTQAAFNKAPSAVYYYLVSGDRAEGWKLVGDGLADHSSDIIPAGSAMLIRKSRTSDGHTAFWTNAPTY